VTARPSPNRSSPSVGGSTAPQHVSTVIALCAVLRTATGVASPLWLAGTCNRRRTGPCMIESRVSM